MYSLQKLKVLAAVVLAGSAGSAQAAALVKTGSEYPFLGSLPGDQVQAHLSLNDEGGFLVTQDNSIDGNGLGIRARRYYADLSASRWTFQVNSSSQGEQQNGRVAVLAGGGAFFAWQGSTGQGNRIFVRMLRSDGQFAGPEQRASDHAVGNQSEPAVAALSDGSVVVVWTEMKRDGHMQGVFGQMFNAAGDRVGGTFQINQNFRYGQRSAVLAALPGARFAVAWVQESAGTESIPIYGRIYLSNGQPATDARRLSAGETIAANPSLVAISGGFRAAWSARRPPDAVQVNPSGFEVRADSTLNGWDVVTRSFDADGAAVGGETVVNSTRIGDQFAPRLVSFGANQLAVWTSFGQDGADEGIFGRVIADAGFDGPEFLVNTRTIGKQINPAVGRVGEKVVVAWSSFMGGLESYDLFAQNFSVAADLTLSAPTAPFVSKLSFNSICVTWAEQLAQPVEKYLVYVDDEAVAEETAGGMLVVTRNWAPKSTHAVQLAYRTEDGRVSPKSAPVTVTTYSADTNGDGLPDDWQTENWGKVWPPSDADSDGDGASNAAEFLAGTDPTSAGSVLSMSISPREQGLYLVWNTLPGSFYQLQVTSDFKTWQNVGTPRFAPSTEDAAPIAAPGQVQYYRVIRMR
jgi:hypothetical protein